MKKNDHSLTSQFREHFHDEKVKAKNDEHIKEFYELSENIEIIKNSDNLKDITNSLKYILNHIGNLQSDDSLEIGPCILNYALDFENPELAVISIHILGILVRNSDQTEFFQPICQEFIENAQSKSDIIFNYLQGNLTPVIVDLIFSFIKFSKEMYDFSIENKLIYNIINEYQFCIEEDDFNQASLHLQLIFDIAKAANNKEILLDIFSKVSKAMDLNIPQLYDACLIIYNAIFDFRKSKELNREIKPLFDAFYTKYFGILYENCQNKKFLLDILLNIPSFILKEYQICDFLLDYLQMDLDQIVDNEDVDLELIEFSWKIIGNYTKYNEGNIIFLIMNHIADNALEIYEEGPIKMKCFVRKVLTNILLCSYDQNIYQYVLDSSLFDRLLSAIEYLPFECSKYIIKSVCKFIQSNKILFTKKIKIIQEANSDTLSSSMNNFLELCTDEDLNSEAAVILQICDDQFDDDELHDFVAEEDENGVDDEYEEEEEEEFESEENAM